MNRYPGAQWSPSPNIYREGNAVELVVCHYTAGGATSGSVSWLCSPAAKASAHFVIGRDGKVFQLAELQHRTWHAGGATSGWNGLRVNSRSIGVEFANWGPLQRLNGKLVTHTGAPFSGQLFTALDGRIWEAYPAVQLDAGRALIRWLGEQYPRLRTPSPGPLPRVCGHQDVDPSRKQDPGPAFPDALAWLT
jgi:N-acetylmuramoyl-L-alanine amidase